MGVPLRNDHDLALGSLCIMGAGARAFTLSELEILSAVAQIAVDALHLKDRDADRFIVTKASFQRLFQAVLRHEALAGDSVCLSGLPTEAANAPWDEGLDFVTLSDTWDCLVCSPRSSQADTTIRLSPLLHAHGVAGAPVVVESQPGSTWFDLYDSLVSQLRQPKTLSLEAF